GARDRLVGGRCAFAADLRYRGKEHTIPIAVDLAADLTNETAATVERFHVQHDSRYGHAAPDQSIEIVNLRLVVTVPRMEDAILRWLSEPWRAEAPAPEQTRPVIFADPERPATARILWR